MTTQPGVERSLKEQVAEEVRVALARKRMTGSGLARLLGKEQTWVSRRLTGTTAFDLDDLQLIAGALDLDVAVLINGGPRPPRGGVSLPHLDSNQKPFGLRPGGLRFVHRGRSSRIDGQRPIAA